MIPIQLKKDSIAAIASPPGTGAIAVIRVSGADCLEICDGIFELPTRRNQALTEFVSNRMQKVKVLDGEEVLDEAMMVVYRDPKSFTGENSIEIFCHGSVYIQQRLLGILGSHGVRMAEPGEFAMRAFLNGKFDLLQAEGISDLISASSSTAHQVAMDQMKGGFSNKIKALRTHLVDFAALVELELDFSEEDVEFANRKDLIALIDRMQVFFKQLTDSFEMGNAIRTGLPVAIVGRPNAGKSTLLNALLGEERAIVSDIPGTTRDTIEDVLVLDGISFRFIDTAGLRSGGDEIERLGMERSLLKVKEAMIVLYVFDVHEMGAKDLEQETHLLKHSGGKGIWVHCANKIDTEDSEKIRKEFSLFENLQLLSARQGSGVENLKKRLIVIFDEHTSMLGETVVTNARHVQELQLASSALKRVKEGLEQNVSGEFLVSEIRTALHHLGLISGEVSTEELLGSIFGRFCIGK